MKAGVDLTAAFGGLTSPAEPGSQIDAGSVTLHPSFMSYMASCETSHPRELCAYATSYSY
jgi:hypothetical protein